MERFEHQLYGENLLESERHRAGELRANLHEQFTPFQLRRMYYRELMKSKPIFLAKSKKGVGFGDPGVLVNQRTAQGISLI